MFDYYFAGALSSKDLITYNCNILCSYLNDKRGIKQLFEAREQGWTGKLLIDNGAFTVHRKGGKVDIDAYINWLNENCNKFDYAIALDEIPGKWRQERTYEQIQYAREKTFENYLYMLKKVNCPEKIIPVVHSNDGMELLQKFLAIPELSYICLSGNKDRSAKERQEWYQQCFDIILKQRPDIKIHCLGSGTLDDIRKFKFTSTDSTTSIMASSCGELCTDYGRMYVGERIHTKKHAFNYPEKKAYIERKCEQYGLDINKLDKQEERLRFNICYYIEKSKETSHQCEITSTTHTLF